MTQLTTLTPAAVRAVLLGLAEHSSGTLTETYRADAVEAMADALTQPRPVDPELALLRGTLAHTLGWDGRDCTDDDLVTEVRDTIARLTIGGDRFRDLLAALLDLDPDADDDTITEAATARAAQRSLHRSAEKTAALVTPASQQGVASRLLWALGWTATDYPEAHVDRALVEVERLANEPIARAAAAMQHELADALGVPMPPGGWPELLDLARALAASAAVERSSAAPAGDDLQDPAAGKRDAVMDGFHKPGEPTG